MAIRSGKSVYVVVDVMCGVATDAYCFERLENAQACAEKIRKGRNLDEAANQPLRCRAGLPSWHQ